MKSFLLLLVVLTARGNAALAPLPQHDNGLAAHYPGDTGIAAHPAVLFHDGFESYTGSALSWAAGIGDWDNAYGTLTITRAAAEVHAGSQAVRINHTGALGTHGADKEVPPHDTLFVRFYLKFAPDFPGVHHAGMGIRGGPAGELFTNHTGQRPTGTNFFTCSLDHLSPLHSWKPAADSIPPGWVYNYCYHMDQGSDYGDVLTSRGTVNNTYPFSADFVSRPNVTPARDRWTCYEIMVQANTIGNSDGRVALWMDGALIADHPGLRLRTVSDIMARYISLSTYSSGYAAGQTLWYDDIVIATSYIGPMAGLNSVTGRLIPAAPRSRTASAAFYDLSGRLVYRGRDLDNDGRDLANGLYLVRVTGPGTTLIVKRMVLH